MAGNHIEHKFSSANCDEIHGRHADIHANSIPADVSTSRLPILIPTFLSQPAILLSMPDKRGRNTFAGYQQPPSGGHSEAEQHVLRTVYGTCRTHHPGEDPATKELCARIAWSEVDKQFHHGHSSKQK